MKKKYPVPKYRQFIKNETSEPFEADFYVDISGDDFSKGSDISDGSEKFPFATIEQAQRAVREKIKSIEAETDDGEHTVTVCVNDGEYHLSGLTFGKDDSSERVSVTYRAKKRNAVILSGGLKLTAEDFHPIEGDMRERLNPDAREHVLQADLKKYGISADDYGKMCASGGGSSAYMYDDGTTGINCELFFNGKRMVCARYPDAGQFIEIADVADIGDTEEFPPQNHWNGFRSMKNPRGGKIIVDKIVNERIKKWKNPETAWMHGYFYWDWSDMTTPVKEVIPESRCVVTAHSSRFGFRKGAPYYFFNVFEELDSPGEWYLDRENSVLYLYPYEPINADTRIEFSYLKKPLINLSGCENITFDGFALRCTCDNGIVLSGCKNVSIVNCSVSDIYMTGITGSDCERCRIDGIEVSRAGHRGIDIHGGDRVNLIPAENIITNCLVHDYAEVCSTCISGIDTTGIGNTISYCEIHTSPTVGLGYTGNDHIIEYNVIHDVVLNSDDAAAIYTGCSWTSRGTVIRYNLIFNIGSETSKPDGIYWDDGMSGQTAYGNMIINTGKYGFMLGGGNGHTIRDNIIINAEGSPIQYDDRCRDAIVNDGWAKGLVVPIGSGILWSILHSNPYKSSKWTERYPFLGMVKEAPEDIEDPYFPPNPAFSVIERNIIIDEESREGIIADSVRRFSRIEGNLIFSSPKDAELVYSEEAGCYIYQGNNSTVKEILNNIPF